jgi:hypothetical protein
MATDLTTTHLFLDSMVAVMRLRQGLLLLCAVLIAFVPSQAAGDPSSDRFGEAPQ